VGTSMYIMCIIHWCIMCKCCIQTCTYGVGEWCQNVLLTKPEIINSKKNQGMYFCHGMSWKKYNPWLIQKRGKKWCMMTWHLNQCHINLGPYSIHFKNFRIRNYLVQHVTISNDEKKFIKNVLINLSIFIQFRWKPSEFG
jgi:hypothetical protein